MLANFFQFSKYIFVGGFNTVISYGIIFFLMYKGVSPEVSNFIGYAFGISLSFLLNKKYTFDTSSLVAKSSFYRYLLVMSIAYCINLLFVSLSYRVLGINPYLSQVLGGFFYTIVGFIGSKYFVFR